MDAIVKKISFVYGIAGSVVIALTYLYIWQQEQYMNGWFSLITLLLPLILAFGAQINSKFKLNGFMSLKQGVMAFAITILLIFITEALINYLIFVEIDPSAQETVAQAQEARKTALEAQGKQIQDPAPVDYSLGGYALATATKFLAYTVLGIIMAFVLKKKRATAA